MRAQQPLALILSRWRHTTDFVRLAQHHLLGSGCWGFLVLSSLWFWKPDQCPSKKVLFCHLLTMGLVSLSLIQWVHGAATMCSESAKQIPLLAGSTAWFCSAPIIWENMRRQKQVGKIIASSRGHHESHTPSVIPQTPNLLVQAEVCVEPKVQLSKPVRRLIPPPALIGVQKS